MSGVKMASKNNQQFKIVLLIAAAVIGILLLKSRGQAMPIAGQSHTPPPNCYDSDGGINYYVFGQVSGYDASGRPYLYNDQCMNTISLYERYCSGSYSNGQQYNCPYGCAAGRCNNQTNTTNTTTQCNDRIDNDVDEHYDHWSVSRNPDSKCSSTADNDERPRDSCRDSDGGVNIFTRGYVNGYDESMPYSYTDTCVTVNILREYYCLGYGWDYAWRSTNINCRNQTNSTNSSCMSGRCM